MTPLHGRQGDSEFPQRESASTAEAERLAMARRIALESLKEDHHALEVDAKLAFGPAAILGR
ncbi:MAG: hypothetical protein HOY69_43205 [Streptomyces sp.]|nr:hypothetical protein [Streptomyces sp.]